MTTITYNGTQTTATETKGTLVRKSNGRWELDNKLKEAIQWLPSPIQVVILIPQK